MVWIDVYKKLEKEVFNNKRVSNSGTIENIKEINETNRLFFIKYHDLMMSNVTDDNELQSYKVRRSKIIDFLIKTDEELPNIDQNKFNEYINYYYEKEKKTNTKNRINYITDFLNRYNKNEIIDEFEINKADISDNMDNSSMPLNSKEIEDLRHHCLSNEKYFELFIFEMLYENKIKYEELKKCSINNYSLEKKSFNIEKKSIFVSDRISKIVEKLVKNKYVNDFDLLGNRTIIKMKEDLIRNGIRKESFKRKDIIDSHRKTFMRCPECGDKYEGTIGYWVVKQYYDGGDMWIVCKKCAGIQ